MRPPRRINPESLVLYLVEHPDGPGGVVSNWIVADDGTPKAMIVSHGWFGRHQYKVHVSEMLGIDHAAKRILVSAATPLPKAEGWIERILNRLGRASLKLSGNERSFFLRDLTEAINALKRLERKVDGFDLEMARRVRELREAIERLAGEITRDTPRR